ncbi:MAG: hypothetical protein JNM36_10905 [Chitinophagales bacterium]|nr:hypothetical protein [Chitinophagales bacterium]
MGNKKRDIDLVIDYDNNWKIVVEAMFEEFLAFFLPEIYVDVDFNQPISFLDKELRDLIREEDKDKIVDKLVQVELKTGESRWILVHLEFQTKPENDFTARMFHYYQIIRSKYNQRVTSFVIYTGLRKPKIYDHYKEEAYSTSLVYRFKTYHVAVQDADILEQNPNPFALVVLANLKVIRTRQKLRERLTAKEHLYDLARQRGYSHEKASCLVYFIGDLMKLSLPLAEEFKNYIVQNQPKNTTMFEYSQDTIEIVEVLFKAARGVSTLEALKMSEAARLEAEAARLEAERKAEAARLETEQQARLKEISQIIYSYKTLQLPIKTIAELFGKSPEAVQQILTTERLIEE